MIKALKYLLVPAVVVASSVAAQAQLSLPGKTLRLSKPMSRGGDIVQPNKNPKNILKAHTSPDCPYIGKSLRVLMLFARANCPDLYRQAVKLRRTGFTQAQTRDFLEHQICLKWEAGLVT